LLLEKCSIFIYMVPLGVEGRKLVQHSRFSLHRKTSLQHFRVFWGSIEPKFSVKGSTGGLDGELSSFVRLHMFNTLGCLWKYQSDRPKVTFKV